MRTRILVLAALSFGASLVVLVPTAAVRTSSLSNPSFAAATLQKPPRADTTPAATTPTCKPGLARFGSKGRDPLLTDYKEGEILCARGGNDRIVVNFRGTIVWAGPGADVIITRQSPASPNEIDGGEGQDNATVDRFDNWDGVESARLPSSGHATDLSSVVYPAYQPRIHCRIVNGERRMLFDPMPQIRAVNRTSRVDWQSVAWSPVLTVWNAQTQKYDVVVQNEWLWDRTYDQQVPGFTGNVWRRYTTSQQWIPHFYANVPRLYFRIAVFYYHYAEDGVPANRIYEWVDEYVGEHAAPDGRHCYFRE